MTGRSSNRYQMLLEWLAEKHGTVTMERGITRSTCIIKWPVEEGTRVVLASSAYPQVALRKAINNWHKNHEAKHPPNKAARQ